MSTTIAALVIAGLALVGATVAVCLGHIDQQSYVGLVGLALGGGIGVGAHAAGTSAGLVAASTPTPTAAPVPVASVAAPTPVAQ